MSASSFVPVRLHRREQIGEKNQGENVFERSDLAQLDRSGKAAYLECISKDLVGWAEITPPMGELQPFTTASYLL